MPVYEYQAKDPEKSCAACRDGFELIRSFSDPPVETCLLCHNPVVKKISAANINSRIGDPLSKSNLEAQGFTRYQKDSQGSYRKTAGHGPDLIKK